MDTLSHARPVRIALLLLAALAAAVAVAFAVSRSPASAQAPGTTVLTLTELEKGSTFSHIRNTKTKNRQSNLRGDQIVFTNPMADAAGKTVGRLHVECVTTKGSSNFMRSTIACSGVMTLPGGSLTLQALVSPGVATTAGAITGGTGTYAGARGSFTSVEGRSGSKDTITLIG
ncbi:MAG: hypothetical protein QOI73_949 [Solirubrobacteraceae bacterium]|nr:hypothetical protein [Solirubrobacteraceae bacterium]